MPIIVFAAAGLQEKPESFVQRCNNKLSAGVRYRCSDTGRKRLSHSQCSPRQCALIQSGRIRFFAEHTLMNLCIYLLESLNDCKGRRKGKHKAWRGPLPR